MRVIRMRKYFVFLFVLAFNHQYAQTPATDPNAPVPEPEKVIYDYGTIEYNSDGEGKIKITNTGKSPLVITDVKSNCGCVTPYKNGGPNWTVDPIAAGKSGFVGWHYDTKRIGPFTKYIYIYSNSSPEMIIRLIGTVLPPPGK